MTLKDILFVGIVEGKVTVGDCIKRVWNEDVAKTYKAIFKKELEAMSCLFNVSENSNAQEIYNMLTMVENRVTINDFIYNNH